MKIYIITRHQQYYPRIATEDWREIKTNKEEAIKYASAIATNDPDITICLITLDTKTLEHEWDIILPSYPPRIDGCQ